MAERATLQAERRTVLGKKVKRLRQQGILPANIYGRNLESVAVQLDMRGFIQAVKESGVRSMFEVAVDGENEPRYVIIRGLDRHSGVGNPLHVDFYQVDLRRPVQTTVPVNLVGESLAVKDLGGTLLQNIEFVSVECLPLDIPAAIEADISIIDSFDITITVADLPVPEGVTILTDPAVSVAAVAPPRIRADVGEEEEGLEGEAAPAEGGAATPAAEPAESEE